LYTESSLLTKLVQRRNVGIQIVKVVRIWGVVFRGPFSWLGHMFIDTTFSLGFIIYCIEPGYSLQEMMQLGVRLWIFSNLEKRLENIYKCVNVEIAEYC